MDENKIDYDKIVELKFEELLSYCNNLGEDGIKLVKDAFALAKEAHAPQKRKSGEPYIMHPLEVAIIVAREVGLGAKGVSAAILHDVVEDTNYSVADIKRMFGSQVANIVSGLTKITGAFEQNTSLQAENFRKIVVTLVDDMRVMLIKLADRLHNMRTLDSMPQHKQMKIAGETIYFYAPMAQRIGLFHIKTELENLSLKYRYPNIYEELSEKIASMDKSRQFYVDNFAVPVIQKLKEEGLFFRVKRSPKSIYAVWHQMQEMKASFDEVYHVLNVDVIFEPKENVPEKNQCWSIYSVLTDIYIPKTDRIRDFVTTPKANGYEGLHATFMGPNGRWVDVRIRSERMNEIAERGYAAYLNYKDEKAGSNEFDKWIQSAKEVLFSQSEDAVEFVDDFLLNLYSGEIMVFTPKGQLKNMPHDSTAIDFAFEIHTEIGNHAMAAKVNHKLVGLSQVLKGGDQVEILTSEKQTVSYEWLDYAKTAKAKTNIKKALKAMVQDQVIVGRKMLDEKLAELSIQANSKTFRRILAHYNCSTKAELYSNIGGGIISIDNIEDVFKKKKLNEWIKYWGVQFGNNEDSGSVFKSSSVGPVSPVALSDKEDARVSYTVATCCKPIPGDQIIGFKAKNDNVVVHKANCPTAVRAMSNIGNTIVPVKWRTETHFSYLARLKIESVDSEVICEDVVRVISNDINVKIKTFKFDSSDGIAESEADVYIQDAASLAKLMKELEKVKGVDSVRQLVIQDE
jgi:GTP pyrophosphokinase